MIMIQKMPTATSLKVFNKKGTMTKQNKTKFQETNMWIRS